MIPDSAFAVHYSSSKQVDSQPLSGPKNFLPVDENPIRDTPVRDAPAKAASVPIL
jgi:hypothetical protein